jgi:hypothetical protein
MVQTTAANPATMMVATRREVAEENLCEVIPCGRVDEWHGCDDKSDDRADATCKQDGVGTMARTANESPSNSKQRKLVAKIKTSVNCQ